MTQHENPQQGFIRADCGRPARFPDFGGDYQADESEDESAPIIDSCVKITILLVYRYFAIAWSDGNLIDWTDAIPSLRGWGGMIDRHLR
jgi:hypothetical protein